MRSKRRTNRLLSWVFILGGAVLLFVGARDFLSSIFGQREAAEEWHKPVQSRQPAPQTPDLGVALAKLSIPRLNAAWFVFEGVGKKELRLGPGHMRGSALPGTSGNCVIAGHRDTHFRALKDIRKGDEIVVETRQGRFRYRVTDLEIVKPTNTKALAPTTSPVMNLITCYPFYYLGSAPKRFVVHAQMEPLEVAHSGAPPS